MKAHPPLSRFERSPLTQAVVDRVIAAAPGETVSYFELSTLAGGDVQHEARPVLDSARRILLNQEHIVTDAVTNIGIKRLTPEGTVAVSDGMIRRHRSLTRRATKTLATVGDPEALPGPVRQRFTLNRIRLGLLEMLTGKRVERKLLAEAATTDLPAIRRGFLGLFGKS